MSLMKAEVVMSNQAHESLPANPEIQDNTPTAPAEQRGRRDFLVSLGRWSKVVIGGALLGGALTPERDAGAVGWGNRGGGHGGSWVNLGGGGGGWGGSWGWGGGSGGWYNGGRGSWYNGGGWYDRPWNNRPWYNRPWYNGGWYNGGGGSWYNR